MNDFASQEEVLKARIHREIRQKRKKIDKGEASE